MKTNRIYNNKKTATRVFGMAIRLYIIKLTTYYVEYYFPLSDKNYFYIM
jgi:hypothetical protein